MLSDAGEEKDQQDEHSVQVAHLISALQVAKKRYDTLLDDMSSDGDLFAAVLEVRMLQHQLNKMQEVDFLLPNHNAEEMKNHTELGCDLDDVF